MGIPASPAKPPRLVGAIPSAVLAGVRGCVTEPRRVPGDRLAAVTRPLHHLPRPPSPATRSFESGSRAIRYPSQRSTVPAQTSVHRNATASAPSTRDQSRHDPQPAPVEPSGQPLPTSVSAQPKRATTDGFRPIATLPPLAAVPEPRLNPTPDGRLRRDLKTRTSTISQVLGDGPLPWRSRACRLSS
jgi:hypothetical protein